MTSCRTSTCPSHSVPAPIPIVGIPTIAVIFAATAGTTSSSSNPNAPAFSTAIASAISAAARLATVQLAARPMVPEELLVQPETAQRAAMAPAEQLVVSSILTLAVKTQACLHTTEAAGR